MIGGEDGALVTPVEVRHGAAELAERVQHPTICLQFVSGLPLHVHIFWFHLLVRLEFHVA
jgi:hypothetical protein